MEIHLHRTSLDELIDTLDDAERATVKMTMTVEGEERESIITIQASELMEILEYDIDCGDLDGNDGVEYEVTMRGTVINLK